MNKLYKSLSIMMIIIIFSCIFYIPSFAVTQETKDNLKSVCTKHKVKKCKSGYICKKCKEELIYVRNSYGWDTKIGKKSCHIGSAFVGTYNEVIPAILEAEMSCSFDTEALKAQAVAAYCFLYNSGATKGNYASVALRTPTSKTINAASSVKNKRVYYNGKIANTFYYAVSAGYTANSQDIWYEKINYLQGVPSKVDCQYGAYCTKVKYKAKELRKIIKKLFAVDISKQKDKTKWFRLGYDSNNCYVKTITFGKGINKKKLKGYNFSTMMGFRSGAFTIKYNKKTSTFTFVIKGFGHGVGMSQVGANYYSKLGWSYKKILRHYYKGCNVLSKPKEK